MGGMGRRRLRHAAAMSWVLLVTALGLGLVAPVAQASCAGPQVQLEQGGAPVEPRRVGEGEAERLIHDVVRGEPLRVLGSNLTFDCRDTYATQQVGCGAPVEPPEPAPIAPMQDVRVVLTQGTRSWTLAALGPIGADLDARVEVELPRAVRPGPAVLALVEREARGGAELDLLVA